jgi:hypothetical protein
MDLGYLTNELLPLRKQEILQGKNCATAQPIYVVLDLQENIVSGHTDYTPSTNYKGLDWQFGYMDEKLDPEYREFKLSEVMMKKPIRITRFYTDRIVAFFLTSKGAHDYLEYQKHNLNKGYVYVFYSGYGNKEMNILLSDE